MFSAAVFSVAVGAQTPQIRLGNPQVLSSLGSPLWVRIPIDVTEASEDVTAARFSLGARPLNAPVPFVERAEIGLERQGNKYSLVIRSKTTVDEPAIGIVLREELPNGVRSRQFFLLLDPAPVPTAVIADQGREPAGSEGGTVLVPPSQPIPVQAIIASPPLSVAQPTAPTTAATAPKRATQRRAQTRTRPIPAAGAVTETATATMAGPSTISPVVEGKAARKNRSATAQPKVEGGPRLKLSFGEGLTTRPATTEAERAQLRMRQFTLDMDDLTSGLLERQHKITQLEKELAGLSLRVSAAEKLLGTAPAVGAAAAAQTAQVAEVPPAPIPASDATPPIQPPPAAMPVSPPAAKARVEQPVQTRSMSVWTWLLIGAGMLAALAGAIWGVRHMLRRRDQNYRLTAQRAEDYVAEVLAQAPSKKDKTNAAAIMPAIARDKAASAKPSSPPSTQTQNYSPPEIHFELPELPADPDVALHNLLSSEESASRTVTSVVPKPAEDASSRRMRYLQSRYQDIAILMPPLDAPQRLLRQAATVYDEGATDYAKRLLKYASYSRPYTEEFWLALLELLYREKFASDYLVNAKWFRQYHPESTHWDELLRIGYLLDATEPLFAIAAHWSHEEPVAGVWLPSNPGEKKPLPSLSHLKLEIAG